MAYQQKPNTGSLFVNDKKETETHPDYKGSAIIDGKEYFLSAWLNVAKSSGKKYLSITFKSKEEFNNQRDNNQQSSNSGFPSASNSNSGFPSNNINNNFDDDIPF